MVIGRLPIKLTDNTSSSIKLITTDLFRNVQQTTRTPRLKKSISPLIKLVAKIPEKKVFEVDMKHEQKSYKKF